jgi:hypothetical protein
MERRFEGGLSKKIERKEIVDKAFSLAKEILKRTQIDERDFTDVYGSDVVDKDREYVEKRNSEFKQSREGEEGEAQENFKLATIFEAIVVVAREWFGKNCQTFKTADFDDIANGVDVIAKLDRKEEAPSSAPIGIAIDVTYHKEFEDKIDRIRNEIEKGKMSSVKYFGPHGKNKGPESPEIVRAVIGASKETVIGLAETLIAATKNPKILFENQFQFQALDEIIYQLKAYEAYAKSIGRDFVAEKYGRTLSQIREIKKERSESLTDGHQRDEFFENLIAYLDSSLKPESK